MGRRTDSLELEAPGRENNLLYRVLDSRGLEHGQMLFRDVYEAIPLETLPQALFSLSGRYSQGCQGFTWV